MRVEDEYRTNGLSLIPGGNTVKVIYQNGKSLTYDKIKNPSRYISTLLAKTEDEIAQILVNGNSTYKK